MRYLKSILTTVFLTLILSACGPWPTSPPPPGTDPVQNAIEMHFAQFGEHVVQQAKEVAWCESKFNNEAENGQYKGLFQLGAYHYWRLEGIDWRDSYANARAAAGLYGDKVANGEYGWQPWSCRP